jgi:hypothetical protein
MTKENVEVLDLTCEIAYLAYKLEPLLREKQLLEYQLEMLESKVLVPEVDLVK